MADIISSEAKVVMDEALKLRKSPNRFLQNLLFPASVRKAPLPVDTVQWDEITYNRIMAPFTNPYGNAYQITSQQGESRLIKTPDIFLKNPLTTAEDYFNRALGDPNVFLGRGSANPMARAIEDALYDGFVTMVDMAVNTKEWMAAMVLQGKMSYTNTITGVSFTLDLNKPAANEPEAAVGWDDPDDTKPQVLLDIMGMNTLMAEDEVPFVATDILLGTNAYNSLLRLINTKRIPNLETISNITVGSLTLINEFSEMGATYLGTLCGKRLWYYCRKDQSVGGTELIRPDYLEFVSTDAQASGRQMEFGCHKGDIIAVRNNEDICEERTWIVEQRRETSDRPSIIGYYETRPLLYTKCPQYLYSMKVTNL